MPNRLNSHFNFIVHAEFTNLPTGRGLKTRALQIHIWCSCGAGGRDLYGHPRRQSLRGSKIGGQINRLNKKILSLKNFKLFSQMERKSIIRPYSKQQSPS